MFKAMATVMLLPLWIWITLVSPILCHIQWVKTDKELGKYESFWKTWKENIIDIWTADYDDIF